MKKNMRHQARGASLLRLGGLALGSLVLTGALAAGRLRCVVTTAPAPPK